MLLLNTVYLIKVGLEINLAIQRPVKDNEKIERQKHNAYRLIIFKLRVIILVDHMVNAQHEKKERPKKEIISSYKGNVYDFAFVIGVDDKETQTLFYCPIFGNLGRPFIEIPIAFVD
ncbi:unnamed protein product [Rhizophagus irregularis]|nr:unnamed protein product [Rhizophagus irregularis]